MHWTEMPGSKIRATSILDMAWEMLTLKVGCGGCARMECLRGRWGVGDGRLRSSVGGDCSDVLFKRGSVGQV